MATDNYRNRALLDLARGAPCMGLHCRAGADGTVVAAHSNSHIHGKGARMKAHDWAIAFLCHKCHSMLDQGAQLSRDEREEFWRDAAIRTTGWLWEQGLIQVTGKKTR